MSLVKFATADVLSDHNIKNISPKYTLSFNRTLEASLAPSGQQPTIDYTSEYYVDTRWLATLVDETEVEVEKSRILLITTRDAFIGSSLYGGLSDEVKGTVRGHLRQLIHFQGLSVASAAADPMIPTNISPDYIPGVDPAPAPGAHAAAAEPLSHDDLVAKFAVRATELAEFLASHKKLGSVVLSRTENKDGEKVRKTEFDGIYELRDQLAARGVPCDDETFDRLSSLSVVALT